MTKTRAAALCAALLLIAGCSSPEEPVTMPAVEGLRLDIALSDLERAGYTGDPEVLSDGLFGVVDEANWVVCEQLPAAGEVIDQQPRLSVDRECAGLEPQNTASEAPSSEPTPTESVAAEPPYEYEGPEYDVVTIDEEAGFGVFDQHWVYIDPKIAKAKDYKDQIKLIISDLAHKAESADLIVQIVTDKEIIEAESTSTGPEYMNSIEPGYWEKVMAPKEKKHWVAWYTGGDDYDESVLSDADVAYGIDWWPAGDYKHEQWKPQANG